MDPVDLEPLAESMEGALLLYNSLAEDALAANQLLWDITPKFHMATHLAFDVAVQVIPRHVHCYPTRTWWGTLKGSSSAVTGARQVLGAIHAMSSSWDPDGGTALAFSVACLTFEPCVRKRLSPQMHAREL